MPDPSSRTSENKRGAFRGARLALWLAFAFAAVAIVVQIHSVEGPLRFLAVGLFPALIALLLATMAFGDRLLSGKSGTPGLARPLLVFSLLWFVALLLFAGLGRLLAQGPDRARAAVCRQSEAKLLSAMLTYAGDAGHLPTSHAWQAALTPILRSQGVDIEHQFRCAEADTGAAGDRRLQGSYAFNGCLSSMGLGEIPDPAETVVVYETDAGTGWNAAGGPELLPDIPRHHGGDNYAFADGHVQWLPRRKNPDGTWAKQPDAAVTWAVGERGQGEAR
jgi:prepilin-type processing-associated H-X9-DG protein